MRMAKNEIELKPCPFCGRKAELREHKYDHSPTQYTPRCTDKSCPGRLTRKYIATAYAIKAWNRRVNDGSQ